MRGVTENGDWESWLLYILGGVEETALWTSNRIRTIHEKMPDATCILIVPPDHAELTRRLRGRGSENEAELAKRLGKAAEEIAAAEQSGVYNHVVVNDDLDEAVREIVEIVRSQRE